MKKGLDIVVILKYLSLAALLAFLIILLNIVGGSGRTFQEVAAPLEQAMTNSTLEQVDHQRFRRLFGQNPADFVGVMMFESSFHLSAEEVILIQVQDADQIREMTERLEYRLANRYEEFLDYLPEQASLIEEAQLVISGNFIFLAVMENAYDLREIFVSSL